MGSTATTIQNGGATTKSEASRPVAGISAGAGESSAVIPPP
jgi:hypothetical protein